MAYIVVAYIVMAYIVMAYIVMAYIVMAYIVMAYIVMAVAERYRAVRRRLGTYNHCDMPVSVQGTSRSRHI